MRSPTMARTTAVRATLLVASALLLAACGEVTSPTGSSLSPTGATNLAGVEKPLRLVDVEDGTYYYTIDPKSSQTLQFGKSHLDLPANAICALKTSGYGTSLWNTSCQTETKTVTISVTLRNAKTNNPSVDFSPAMRFNPATNVQLYLYVTNAATLNNMAVMKYCPTLTSILSPSCIDESINDASLKTTTNASLGLVFRRIKHFSGYVVAEDKDDGSGSGQ